MVTVVTLILHVASLSPSCMTLLSMEMVTMRGRGHHELVCDSNFVTKSNFFLVSQLSNSCCSITFDTKKMLLEKFHLLVSVCRKSSFYFILMLLINKET